MNLKTLQKSTPFFLAPIINNQKTSTLLTHLTKHPTLSISELGGFTGFSSKDLRQELVFLAKQNLVSFQQEIDGVWHVSLNRKTLENLIYLPLYFRFVDKRYGATEQLIIMNLLLNFSKD